MNLDLHYLSEYLGQHVWNGMVGVHGTKIYDVSIFQICYADIYTLLLISYLVTTATLWGVSDKYL